MLVGQPRRFIGPPTCPESTHRAIQRACAGGPRRAEKRRGRWKYLQKFGSCPPPPLAPCTPGHRVAACPPCTTEVHSLATRARPWLGPRHDVLRDSPINEATPPDCRAGARVACGPSPFLAPHWPHPFLRSGLPCCIAVSAAPPPPPNLRRFIFSPFSPDRYWLPPSPFQ